MMLYELPRGSLFTIDEGMLLETPNAPVYQLHHLDGMYSVCYTADKNELIHLHVGTPVKKVEVH